VKRFVWGLSALLGCGVPVMAFASGQALFESRCQACHQGNAGGNEAMKAPALAGLSSEYLALQLRHFREGVRGAASSDVEGQVMAGMAKGLDEEQIKALSEYLAGLPQVMAPRPAAPEGFAARGTYSSCSSCHGAGAEGVESLGAPRLAGQHSWYIKAQLEKFRKGVRGAHEQDERGQQMRQMALAIPSDAAIETLVRYIGQQGR
jgi:cytochrome c553